MSEHEPYETHVTVRCEPAELARWAAPRGLKVTHIVLSRGRTPSQPMLTVRGEGPYAARRAAAEELAAALRADGFAPVRVKIETVPWSTQPPGPGGGYFEHHVKLLLPADFDRPALEALAVGHAAHLSWNARRAVAGGNHERFVTQRCHGATAAEADAACDALVAALTAAGYGIRSEERELVVYDSDLSVDAGWIDADRTDGDRIEEGAAV
ncbi:hypothetical protein [Streptomyces sp. NPDC093225]|uniref:hypothetical protein n=1 Tax=Streptomyces sp. NPDC093225 TaxID=3366034 RepID=UPI00380252C6